MTRDEILAMVPGPAMDAVVAVKVIGWGNITKPYFGDRYHGMMPLQFSDKKERFGDDRDYGYIPNYSTDISAAWEVREWLLDNRGGVRLERFCDAETPEYCEVYRGKECKLIQVWATTTPESICKAALLSLSMKVPK